MHELPAKPLRRTAMLLATLLPFAAATQPDGDAARLLIPGPPGGGWYEAARAIGAALLQAGLVGSVEYEHVDGAGGWRGFEHFLAEPGLRNALMVQSLPLLSRHLGGSYRKGFRDLLPLASLLAEYEAVVVRHDSPLRSLRALLQQVAQAPGAQGIVLGSSRDSVDHVAARLLFRDVGSGPFSSHRYVFRSGDGEALRTLLAGTGLALLTGFSGKLLALHRAGRLRVLAISSPQRLVPDIPSWAEQGVDTPFANWRGLFARPDIEAAPLARWRQRIAALVAGPAWRDTLRLQGWHQRFLVGAEFSAFLEAEERWLRPLIPVKE